jgi:hypothetical protein
MDFLNQERNNNRQVEKLVEFKSIRLRLLNHIKITRILKNYLQAEGVIKALVLNIFVSDVLIINYVQIKNCKN